MDIETNQPHPGNAREQLRELEHDIVRRIEAIKTLIARRGCPMVQEGAAIFEESVADFHQVTGSDTAYLDVPHLMHMVCSYEAFLDGQSESHTRTPLGVMLSQRMMLRLVVIIEDFAGDEENTESETGPRSLPVHPKHHRGGQSNTEPSDES